MKTIWKYELEPQQNQKVKMPKGAVVLHADEQRDEICIWCEVNPDALQEDRQIDVYDTGFQMDDAIIENSRYVSSVKLRNGTLIFHVYERLI
jgi:hypothetical protein